MADQRSITPPPELVKKWMSFNNMDIAPLHLAQALATQAANWGANHELDACCEWFVRDWTDIETADKLRAARRPKPPSLKEQALEALQSMQIDPVTINGVNVNADVIAKYDTIRRALKQLDD